MAGPGSLHGSSAKAPHLCMQNARSRNKHVRNLHSPWSGSGSGTRCILHLVYPSAVPLSPSCQALQMVCEIAMPNGKLLAHRR